MRELPISSFPSVFNRRTLSSITFNAIGFGVVCFCFSYFPAVDNLPRAAEYGARNAIGVWFALALAFVIVRWTSRVARPPFSGAVACALGFGVVNCASSVFFSGDEGPFPGFVRGSVLGLVVGLLFGSAIFARAEDAVASPSSTDGASEP